MKGKMRERRGRKCEEERRGKSGGGRGGGEEEEEEKKQFLGEAWKLKRSSWKMGEKPPRFETSPRPLIRGCALTSARISRSPEGSFAFLLLLTIASCFSAPILPSWELNKGQPIIYFDQRSPENGLNIFKEIGPHFWTTFVNEKFAQILIIRNSF